MKKGIAIRGIEPTPANIWLATIDIGIFPIHPTRYTIAARPIDPTTGIPKPRKMRKNNIINALLILILLLDYRLDFQDCFVSDYIQPTDTPQSHCNRCCPNRNPHDSRDHFISCLKSYNLPGLIADNGNKNHKYNVLAYCKNVLCPALEAIFKQSYRNMLVID